MQAVRKIQKVDSDHISIKIPKAFRNRTLEVIVMLADELIPKPETVDTWPKDFFAKTAGCFAGTPLVRENQGRYEVLDKRLGGELTLINKSTTSPPPPYKTN